MFKTVRSANCTISNAVTARIWLIYIITIRPLEYALVHLLTKGYRNHSQNSNITETYADSAPSLGKTYCDHLFASRGEPLSITRLRFGFEKSMKN